VLVSIPVIAVVAHDALLALRPTDDVPGQSMRA
jgi:hypothetical protein